MHGLGMPGACWRWVTLKPKVAVGGQSGGGRDGTLPGDGLQQDEHTAAFRAQVTFAIQCAIRPQYTC